MRRPSRSPAWNRVSCRFFLRAAGRGLRAKSSPSPRSSLSSSRVLSSFSAFASARLPTRVGVQIGEARFHFAPALACDEGRGESRAGGTAERSSGLIRSRYERGTAYDPEGLNLALPTVARSLLAAPKIGARRLPRLTSGLFLLRDGARRFFRPLHEAMAQAQMKPGAHEK